MPLVNHRIATAPADLAFMARAVASSQLSTLYTGSATPSDMRGATQALLAHPMVRQPLAGVPVRAATLGAVAGEWLGPAPDPAGSAALFLHGGGYVRGSLALGRIDASELAHLAQLPVFNLAYRQAPEHRFPAALDDVLAAFEALLALGFDASRLHVVGESAGGGMAVAMAMQLRDRGRPLPASLAAISPLVDMTMAGESWQTHAGKDLITRAMGQQLMDLYMGDADRRDPRASPAFGSFAGLPPLGLHLGGHELLYSDVERLAHDAAAAGAAVELWTYEGLPHGFTKFAIAAAGHAMANVARGPREG